MSRKKRSQSNHNQIVKSEVMFYRDFFNYCQFKGLVKPWQEREIHSFFKDLGLTDKESLDTYRNALEKY